MTTTSKPQQVVNRQIQNPMQSPGCPPDDVQGPREWVPLAKSACSLPRLLERKSPNACPKAQSPVAEAWRSTWLRLVRRRSESGWGQLSREDRRRRRTSSDGFTDT